MNVEFFTSAEEFMGWLEKYHAEASEVWVGLNRKTRNGPSALSYSDAVTTALCYGWIDGLTKSIDPYSYTVRFTPRKPGSNWSKTNIKRVGELINNGRMHPSGLAAFEKRKPENSRLNEIDRENARLSLEMETMLKENRKAWLYYNNCSDSYKKTCTFWIMSAKQEKTRFKRLMVLIESSAAMLRIPLLRPGTGHEKSGRDALI